MSDSPSRLALLQFARKVVLQQATAALQQIDGWIADEQRREAEKRRGLEQRPAPPDWLVQYGLNRKNLDFVHTGDCWAAAKSGRCRPVSRDQALEALQHHVPACDFCRPDSALGFME